MEKITLTSLNKSSGDSIKKFRKQGKIPAVLYGHNVKNQSLFVDLGEFEKAYRRAGDSTIIELKTADDKIHPVLIQEIQNHFLTNRPIHVDFYEVSMTEKLKTAVSLEFTGEAQAVKALGGTLVKVLDTVMVECLPADLPHSLTVDISSLQTFQDVILAKNIRLPANVDLITNHQDVVAKVQPPRDVEAELAAPVVEDVSKVEGAAEIKPEAAAAAADSKTAAAEPAGK